MNLYFEHMHFAYASFWNWTSLYRIICIWNSIKDNYEICSLNNNVIFFRICIIKLTYYSNYNFLFEKISKLNFDENLNIASLYKNNAICLYTNVNMWTMMWWNLLENYNISNNFSFFKENYSMIKCQFLMKNLLLTHMNFWS